MNKHDTAVLIADDLGGLTAVITRGSAAAAVASRRRWRRAKEAIHVVTSLGLVFAALAAAITVGWAVGSWVLSSGVLPRDMRAFADPAVRSLAIALPLGLLFTTGLYWLSLANDAGNGLAEAVAPAIYVFTRPLGRDTATPYSCGIELLDRDVLGHSSWETGCELTGAQRSTISDSGQADFLEAFNAPRAHQRRANSFAGHPLGRAQVRPLPAGDRISRAQLSYTSGLHRREVTTLRLHYTSGEIREATFVEDPAPEGPFYGWLMLHDLAKAQDSAIPYSCEISPGRTEEGTMYPVLSRSS